MRPTLPSLLLLTTLSTTAQIWCPPGAEWIYDTGSPWMVANTHYVYAADTIVDGFMSQRIEATYRIVQWFGNDTLIENSWPAFHTRTNGDVVWEHDGTNWDTLYWFSAVPGDSWQPFWPYGEVCPDFSWVVLDTSTTWVGGIALRTLDMDLAQLGTPIGQPFTIMERVGGRGGANFPGHPPCGGIYECYCTFGCYEDQDITHPGALCDFTLALSDLAVHDDGVQLFPNPAAVGQSIMVDLPEQCRSCRLSVVSATGQLVEDHTLDAFNAANVSTFSFPISHFAPGIYFLHLVRDGTWIGGTRLVIE